jgi:hypothetical protein
VAKLFAQRTEDTGQLITPEALDYVYEQSGGQPWIVNSLFERATMRVLTEDNTETVTIEYIRQARQQMIDARETHLDALGERLRDPAIKRVVYRNNIDASAPAYLVIFDRRPKAKELSWDERISWSEDQASGVTVVTVVGN